MDQFVCDGTCAGNEFGDCNHGESNDGLHGKGAQALRDALTDAELDAERMKITALRLRAVVLAAREFAPVGNPTMFNQYERELIKALRDLDGHDAHHGVHVHMDEAKRRGLPTYEGSAK